MRSNISKNGVIIMGNINLKFKILFLSIFLIFILSIGIVCATQDDTGDDSLYSIDNNDISLEKTDFNTNNKLGAGDGANVNDENNLLSANSNDVLRENNPTEVSNYEELSAAISNGENVTLTNDIDFTNQISITTNGLVINGAGFTVNAVNSRLFLITANNTVISNLNFINGVSEYNTGGAIYYSYSSNNVVRNCNFTNNDAIFGGAIGYDNSLNNVISDCIFTNNN